MKLFKIIILFALLLVFPMKNSYSEDSQIHWNSSINWQSFEKGKKIVLKSKKPAIIIFYADWCPHCENYSDVFKNSKIINLAKNFVMIKVNVDKEKVGLNYAPDGDYIPRTIFFDNKFKPLYKFKSNNDEYKYFLDEESPFELEELMKKALNKS